MSIQTFESVNHKQRASQLRTSANTLDAAGYTIFAEMDRELAEWLDPTPREKPVKAPRRTEAREDYSEGGHVTQRHGATPQRTPRVHTSHREVPRGTSVVTRNTPNGRVLRQMGTH